jgi:GNAT superfamily N-acetyltransferase
MMCVLPSHQGKGLGTRLLEWGLEKATEEGMGVYLTATEKGRELYLKHGFEVIEYVDVNLREYGKDGKYTQTIMVWDKRAAK